MEQNIFALQIAVHGVDLKQTIVDTYGNDFSLAFQLFHYEPICFRVYDDKRVSTSKLLTHSTLRPHVGYKSCFFETTAEELVQKMETQPLHILVVPGAVTSGSCKSRKSRLVCFASIDLGSKTCSEPSSSLPMYELRQWTDDWTLFNHEGQEVGHVACHISLVCLGKYLPNHLKETLIFDSEPSAMPSIEQDEGVREPQVLSKVVVEPLRKKQETCDASTQWEQALQVVPEPGIATPLVHLRGKKQALFFEQTSTLLRSDLSTSTGLPEAMISPDLPPSLFFMNQVPVSSSTKCPKKQSHRSSNSTTTIRIERPFR